VNSAITIDKLSHAHIGSDAAKPICIVKQKIAARPVLRLGYGNWGGSFRWVGGDDDEIDAAEWAAAARNVELGSSPSSIAKGSDIPNDFVLRRMGLAP
jgi:hypothetical protein